MLFCRVVALRTKRIRRGGGGGQVVRVWWCLICLPRVSLALKGGLILSSLGAVRVRVRFLAGPYREVFLRVS